MYIRLIIPQRIPEAGRIVLKSKGDWIKIGRQTAEKWIAQGIAEIPGLDKAEAIAGNLKNAGVFAIGAPRRTLSLRKRYPLLKVKFGRAPELLFERNLLWWTEKIVLLPKQALVGFSRIEATRPGYAAWEIAAMLFGPEATTFGSEAEREKTKNVISDLRIPIFNVYAMWVRRTAATRRIISAWWNEVEDGADVHHAFLRAFYANPVPMCTLPVGWVGIR